VKRHRVDPFSLVTGLLFGFLALFFLVGDHTASDLAWPWAAVVPLMVIGLAALFAGLRRAVADRGPVAAAEPESDTDPETVTIVDDRPVN
jgi:hypothetical protein